MEQMLKQTMPCLQVEDEHEDRGDARMARDAVVLLMRVSTQPEATVWNDGLARDDTNHHGRGFHGRGVRYHRGDD